MIEYTKDVTAIHNKLTKEEQKELYYKMKDGDTFAKDEIIYSCLPLVVDIAKKFRVNNKHIDLEDMVQEGNIALMKAIDKWDIARGSISTVATWYIRNALIDMIHDAAYGINTAMNLSRRAAEEISKIKRVGSGNVKEICSQTNLSEKRVKKLLSVAACKRVNNESADKWLGELSTDSTYSPDQTTEEDGRNCIADIINLAKDNLSRLEQKVFYMWSGIGHKKTGAKQISQELNLTVKETMSIITTSKTTLRKAAKVLKNA